MDEMHVVSIIKIKSASWILSLIRNSFLLLLQGKENVEIKAKFYLIFKVPTDI